MVFVSGDACAVFVAWLVAVAFGAIGWARLQPTVEIHVPTVVAVAIVRITQADFFNVFMIFNPCKTRRLAASPVGTERTELRSFGGK